MPARFPAMSMITPSGLPIRAMRAIPGARSFDSSASSATGWGIGRSTFQPWTRSYLNGSASRGRASARPPPRCPSDGRQFLTWLRDTARLAPVDREPSHDDPVMETVQRYERFLIDERGASPKTVLAYLSTVRDFLGDCFESRCQDLGSLDCSRINGFIRQSCRTQCSATTRVHVAALRSFARYLYRSGIVTADIADGMCRVSTWRLANLPTALAPDQVEAMLASCNRETATGRRDYSVLMLLALLGLRACEVVRLTLDDIDWSNGKITVAGKGGRHDVLPLPHQVGRSAGRVSAGRSTDLCDTTCVCAPLCPCKRVSVIGRGWAYRSQGVRAGIERSGRGAAHLLRHSLATGMLRNGASLEEIGQILRHRSPDSTRIYAKVDLDALRPLAPTWPGGAP